MKWIRQGEQCKDDGEESDTGDGNGGTVSGMAVLHDTCGRGLLLMHEGPFVPDGSTLIALNNAPRPHFAVTAHGVANGGVIALPVRGVVTHTCLR